jgi:hypothetical protein
MYIHKAVNTKGIYKMVESVAIIGMTRRKTAQFNMRFDPELKELAEKAAADDRRSLAALIEQLLEDHLREYGYLKPKRPPGRKRS